jgi:hypothetical protein
LKRTIGFAPPDLNSVLAGSCLATQHAIGLVDLLGDHAIFPGVSEGDWIWIRTRLSRSQRWRFGWGDEVRKHRFTSILDKLSEQLQSELTHDYQFRLGGVSLTTVVAGYLDQLWWFQNQAATSGGSTHG